MDIIHDNGFITWVKIGSAHGALVPSYVYDYTPPEKEAASILPDTHFADSTDRMFLIDSKPATWLSAVYFHKNAEKLNHSKPLVDWVGKRIKEAAAVFGITEDVDRIIQALETEAQEEKVASANPDNPDNYGWVVKADDGTVVTKRYPMFDARGVKLAADYFTAYRSNYPYEMRRKIANAILKKAGQFNVSVSPVIEKEAGYGIPDVDFIVTELMDRVPLAQDADTATILTSMADIVKHASATELVDVMDKVASIIEDFDRGAGLVARYGKTILTPNEIVFSQGIKEARTLVDETIVLNKYPLSLSKLAEVDPEVFSAVLGEDFVTRIKGPVGIDTTKLADELHSLPVPDKQELEAYLMSVYG